MATTLRVGLYSPGDIGGEPFATPFAQFDSLKIVSECTDWQQLQELLSCGTVDAVIVNLDTDGFDGELQLVQHIAEVAPNCDIIGVSQATSPDAIIGAMRAGCSQFVRWPVDSDDLASAVQSIRRTRVQEPQGSQRICIVSVSGGAGATTIACNLAIELAQITDQRCALVDMNLQFGDVACAFNIQPRYTLEDLCRGNVEIDSSVVQSALVTLPCNIAVLAPPAQINMTDGIRTDTVDEALRVLGTMHPFVLVDLPRQVGPLTAAVLHGADRVLLVSQLSVPHLRNASRFYEYLLQLGADEERIELVLNRCNPKMERISQAEVEKQFRRPVFAAVPNDYKRIGTARDLGQSIQDDAPNSPARVAIHKLAKRLTGPVAPKEKAKSGGLLQIFRKG